MSEVSISAKRSVHDTSLVDETITKVAYIEEETPSWAKAIIAQNNEILGAISSLNSTVSTLQAKVMENREDIDTLKADVSLNTEKFDDLHDQTCERDDEVQKLRGEVNSLRDELNNQIDRGLRDHLTFYGIQKNGVEKSWEDTTKVLATWLAEHTEHDYAYFDNAIERCHRGPRNSDKPGPPPIFCKMRWRVAEEIRRALRGVRDGVVVKDKFSDSTQERRNKALLHRQHLKKNTDGIKIYVSYPARVMVKKLGEERYSTVTLHVSK